MEEGRQGLYSKTKSPYIEMSARRSDCYRAIANRAAKKCHLICHGSKTLSLFKLNGAQILDEEVIVSGKTKPWTIGNYMLLMKRSPSKTKLGVGQVTPSDVNSDKVYNYSVMGITML